jgi:phage shock protein A
MALKLSDRIGTLLKADAHGIVESLEERSLVLKQYLREAELEVNRKRARLEAVRDEEKRLGETVRRRQEEIRALDEDVALALGSGKDDLARFAIRRLLPRRAEVKALAARIAERVEEARVLAERVEAQQQQLDVLRTRVRAELARETPAWDAPAWGGEAAVADEEVELELMRRRSPAGGAS